MVLIGPQMTGKSTLMNTFVQGGRGGDYLPTIGVEFATKVEKYDNKRIKLQIVGYFWY